MNDEEKITDVLKLIEKRMLLPAKTKELLKMGYPITEHPGFLYMCDLVYEIRRILENEEKFEETNEKMLEEFKESLEK